MPQEKAIDYFHQGYNCAQSVFAAFAEELGLSEAAALRLPSAFGAGLGRMRGTCGAFSGLALIVPGSSTATSPRTPPTRSASLPSPASWRMNSARNSVPCSAVSSCTCRRMQRRAHAPPSAPPPTMPPAPASAAWLSAPPGLRKYWEKIERPPLRSVQLLYASVPFTFLGAREARGQEYMDGSRAVCCRSAVVRCRYWSACGSAECFARLGIAGRGGSRPGPAFVRLAPGMARRQHVPETDLWATRPARAFLPPRRRDCLGHCCRRLAF